MRSDISTRNKTRTQQFPLTWKRRFPLIHHTALATSPQPLSNPSSFHHYASQLYSKLLSLTKNKPWSHSPTLSKLSIELQALSFFIFPTDVTHSMVLRQVHSLCQHRCLRTVRSSASSFNSHYPLFYLSSSSSCLDLLPRLPIAYIFPCIHFLQ